MSIIDTFVEHNGAGYWVLEHSIIGKGKKHNLHVPIHKWQDYTTMSQPLTNLTPLRQTTGTLFEQRNLTHLLKLFF